MAAGCLLVFSFNSFNFGIIQMGPNGYSNVLGNYKDYLNRTSEYRNSMNNSDNHGYYPIYCQPPHNFSSFTMVQTEI